MIKYATMVNAMVFLFQKICLFFLSTVKTNIKMKLTINGNIIPLIACAKIIAGIGLIFRKPNNKPEAITIPQTLLYPMLVLLLKYSLPGKMLSIVNIAARGAVIEEVKPAENNPNANIYLAHIPNSSLNSRESFSKLNGALTSVPANKTEMEINPPIAMATVRPNFEV